MQAMQRVPVLIVGGGPVGLALAGELGWRGVACMLVEQGDGAIVTPKMNEVNVRTMEFCRRWGIAEQVHACPFPPDYPLDVAFVTSLSGYELGRMPRPPRMSQSPIPTAQCGCRSARRCGSTRFCSVSRAHFRMRACATAPGWNLRGHRRAACAELIDLESGRRERIEADYLVGCDGANSMVRGALGIGLDGRPRPSAASVLPRARSAGAAASSRTFFLASTGRAWSNVRVIDPANAMWRLMVLDTDGSLTPETVDRDGYRAARSAADRGRMARHQHLDPAQRGRRALSDGPRLARRRRRASVLADRRARHEHRHRGRRRSRLEARRVVQGWGGPNLLRATMPSGGRSACATSTWPPNSIWRMKSSTTG